MSKTKSPKTAKPTKTTPKAKRRPDHMTAAGTQKFQCQGPSTWAPFFKELAEKIGGKGAPAGMGIRYALAFAVGHADTKLMASAAKLASSGGKDFRAVDLVGEASGKAASK